MRNNTLHKRIPTTAALIFLLIGLGVTSFLVQKSAIFVGRAGPDKTPNNVVISNVTDKSFTLSFTTNSEADAAISVSSNSMEPTTFFDNRNKGTTRNSYNSHYITVSNLKPVTQYDFSILSDGETYLLNGRKYRVKTGARLITIPKNSDLISGKVIMPDGAPAWGTIVVANITGAQTLSVLTNNKGEYSIPIKGLRAKNLNGFYSTTGDTPIILNFMQRDLFTEVKTTLKAAAKLPLTTLSYQYNFTATESNTATASSILDVAPAQVSAGTISILTPAAAQSFIDNRPQFKGTGVAGKSVAITINPGNIKSSAQINLSGTWNYRPSSALNPGRFTLKIDTTDSTGAARSITQSFSIFASGSQIAGSGPTVTPTPVIKTPTATPTVVKLAPTTKPTATPTTRPTAIPTQIPSATPTITVGATNVPTISATPTLIAFAPSATPIPTVAQTPQSTTAPFITPAATGSFSTFVMGLASILLILGGAALLFIL